MSIQTVVTTVAPSEIDYPKLMRTKEGLIVLFTKWGGGIVIVPKAEVHYIGFISQDWYMDDFKDFTGTITLQNEDKE